jgi:hypothetical protein
VGTINVKEQLVGFKKTTPICGNCVYEKRTRNERRNCIDRTCALHGWFILMSGTCTVHEYRQKGQTNVAA